MNSLKIVVILLFSSSLLLCQVDLNDGLVYLLDFEENIEETVENGGVNIFGNVELSNETYCEVSGQSLFLSGEDSFIELLGTSQFNPENDFTISLWAKIPENQTVFTSTANAIISKWVLDSGDHEKQGYPFSLRVYNSQNSRDGQLTYGRFEGLVAPCTGFVSTFSEAEYNDNEYHHIVIGKSGNLMQMFVDCELKFEVIEEHDCSTANDANIYIGARNESVEFNRPNNFTGYLDDIRFYDRSLNLEELNQLCSCECSPSQSFEDYVGCQGDGYSVLINGVQYDENNPSGLESLTNIAGCDSIVTINLEYDDCDPCGFNENRLNVTVSRNQSDLYTLSDFITKQTIGKSMNFQQLVNTLFEYQFEYNKNRSDQQSVDYSRIEIQRILSKLERMSQTKL